MKAILYLLAPTYSSTAHYSAATYCTMYYTPLFFFFGVIAHLTRVAAPPLIEKGNGMKLGGFSFFGYRPKR